MFPDCGPMPGRSWEVVMYAWCICDSCMFMYYVLCVPDSGLISVKPDAVHVIMLYVMCSGVSPMSGQARWKLVIMQCIMYFGASPMYASLCVICCCSTLRSDVEASQMHYVIMLCMWRGKPDVGESPMSGWTWCPMRSDAGVSPMPDRSPMQGKPMPGFVPM